MLSSTFLHESRNRTLASLLTREERFQLFGNDAVQNGFFRLAGDIFERSVRHAEALRQGFSQLQSLIASGTF
jgi:hypothetical protein